MGSSLGGLDPKPLEGRLSAWTWGLWFRNGLPFGWAHCSVARFKGRATRNSDTLTSPGTWNLQGGRGVHLRWQRGGEVNETVDETGGTYRDTDPDGNREVHFD